MSAIVSGPVDIPELGLIFESPDGQYEGSTLIGSTQTDRVLAYDSEVDVEVILRAGDDVASLGAGDDVISGGDGVDLLIGGAGDDMIFGGNDNDDLYGGAGSDIVAGNAGNDNLQGNGGSDILTGGKGNDRLVADAGQDMLIGGQGKDTFVLSSRAPRGIDEIKDFDPEEDLLEISPDAVPGYRGGFESVETIEGMANTIGIVYDRSSGLLWHFPDQGTPIALVQLSKDLAIGQNDIVIR